MNRKVFSTLNPASNLFWCQI